MKKIIVARILLNSFFALVLFASMGLFPANSFAQTTQTQLSITLANPLGTTTSDIPTFIQKILDGLVLLLTPVIIIMFLWTGFLFVKAQGKPEDLASAKKALLSTIIGAALVLGAKGLSIVIGATIAQL